jgi:outer membrane biosynthesis protein TonB
MNRWAALLVVALAPVVSACMTTRAQTPAERPALEVPPVPPRVLEPVDVGPPARPEPVPDLPPPAANPPRPRPARDNNQREPVKPEPKPETPPAEAQPPQPAPSQATVPPLRISGNADAAQAERQVRETIGRADGLLGKVDYQRLSDGGRKAYNEAKLFMQSSEAALKESNFELAREYAGKAEKLARELQGR